MMSDLMLLGVLRMPVPPNPDPLTLQQFISRARQAADRIEADADTIERLTAELAAARETARRLMDAERVLLADAERRTAQLERALALCASVAEQQAMTDDSWRAEAAAIRAIGEGRA